MKRHLLISAAAVALLSIASAASADCAEELAQLQEGVSKTGAMAPLQESAEATPQTGGGAAAGGESAGEGEIAKTGDTAPLQVDPNHRHLRPGCAGAEPGRRDRGGAGARAPRAATRPREDALARAQAALDNGDEAGCMAAVEEAKSM